MRIGLYGINGVYNFGCEAIVRGTTRFLRDLYPGCEVIYFTFSPDYDRRMLRDLSINFVDMKKAITLPQRAMNKLARGLYLERMAAAFDHEIILNAGLDALFFIGGDILTIPVHERDRTRYFYGSEMIQLGREAVDRNIPVVLYGASVGPFGNYQRAVDYYARNLRGYRQIICRETSTIDYLDSIGVRDNVMFSPDPAFLVEGRRAAENTRHEDGRYGPIAINLSPLSLNELYGAGKYADHLRELSSLLEEISAKLDSDILLVPHVIKTSEGDDDERFQRSLVELMGDEHKKHFSIADTSGGFLGIKQQLASSRMVVSSRMHCAVNAVCEGTPTIFLAYSAKARGMCNYVYSSDQWVLDLRYINEEIIPTMRQILEQDQQVRSQLCARKKEINKYYSDNLNEVRAQLSIVER